MVTELLEQSTWYQRKQGRDHLLLVGLNYGMVHYIGKPKCREFLAGVCGNCTKFAIDDYSYYFASDAGIKFQGDGWHAAPFPSDVHFNKDIVHPFPWELDDDRDLLVSYVGSTQSFSSKATQLKTSLAHFCSLHMNNICSHQSYGETPNNPRALDFNASYDPLSVYRQSIFCFQPNGDMPTRKGLFDGLLQGCIPVVFDIQSAEAMYTWHWEQEYWEDVVVHIDFQSVARRVVDPIEYLQELWTKKRHVVRKKQQLLRARAFELQYSLHGREQLETNNSPENEKRLRGNEKGEQDALLAGKSSLWPNCPLPPRSSSNIASIPHYSPLDSDVVPADGQERTAPCRDAFELIIDWTLAWHSGEVADRRVGSVTECWDGHLDSRLNKCILPPQTM